jgi:hypothetical protein
MIRKGMTTVIALLTAASLAPAQAPAARLHWQTGQVLTYRVEQATFASEVVGESKVETKTQLNLLKRWQVVGVDAGGVATLQLSLASLRLETTTPDGDTLLFDSAHVDKSTPQMREQMARFVNQPLALLRVDGLGRVVEVKESKFGPASRYESEPPFVGQLPADGLKTGQTWERAYKMTLEPPQGAGEKYDAVQKYVCKEIKDGAATVAVTTEVKSPPDALADRVPLLQLQPEGEVVYDLKAGRLRSASLKVDRELKNHQGENSSYRLQCTYKVEYVGDKSAPP